MLSALTLPVNAGPLALTRVLIGLAAMIKGVTFLPRLLILSHPDTLVVPVFGWMATPTQGLLAAISVAWLGAAGMFLLGLQVPVSGSVLTATLMFTLILDQQTYSNHLYLMALLTALATMADAGAALPFPRRQSTREVPLWGPFLIMSQVSVVYLFAAITKINETFLSGQVIVDSMKGGLIRPPDFLTTSGALRTMALLTIAAELFLAVGFWFPKTRMLALLVGIGLHGSIVLLMGPPSEFVAFGLVMLSAYPLFLRTLPAAKSALADGLQKPGQSLLQAGP